MGSFANATFMKFRAVGHFVALAKASCAAVLGLKKVEADFAWELLEHTAGGQVMSLFGTVHANFGRRGIRGILEV